MTFATNLENEAAVLSKSQLVSRILASQQFSRTARLRAFLQYAATRSIEDPGTAISEHDIGIEVFHKRPGYDTAADNIVRVSAGDLRRRLEHYFLDQGRDETLICDMPRGGYALIFHPRPSPPTGTNAGEVNVAAATAEALHPEVLQTSLATYESARFPKGSRSWLRDPRTLLLLTVLSSMLLAGGCILFRLSREPWQRSAPLRALWTPFMAPGSDVDMVLADSSLALTKSLTNAPIGLAEYLGYGYRNVASDPKLDVNMRAALIVIFSRNIGSISDFKAAQNMLSLSTHPEHFILGSAHEFTPEAIKGRNIIIVGSSVSNPWVDLFHDRRSFSLIQDTPGNVAYIRNMQPLPGEPNEYHIAPNDPEGGGYAVVAILPNFDQQKRVLIIEGNDSQATLAASDFITSASGAKAITDRLGSTSLPNHVEVLLRSSKLMATSLQAHIVAVHVKQD